MKESSIGRVLAACFVAMAALGGGCQRETPSVPQPAITAQPASSGPEQSFQTIVESFRRGVEEIPIGFIVPDSSGGRSTMIGRNEVSSELLPPAQDGDPYKGIIKVRSQARYSVQRNTEERSENEQQADQDEEDGALTDDESETQVFDPVLVSPSGNSRDASAAKPGKGDVMYASEENVSERTYELVFENGRWRLITTLDPKTERSIQHAFDRALESQS
jgi:hypothetical protein